MVDMVCVRGDEIVHVGGDTCGDRMTPQTHLHTEARKERVGMRRDSGVC